MTKQRAARRPRKPRTMWCVEIFEDMASLYPVMLTPESARKLAAWLLRFSDWAEAREAWDVRHLSRD
jgi:hypothetical protein